MNLSVSTVLHGDRGAKALRVVNRGGKAGCIENDFPGGPRPDTGKTYVFFMYPGVFINGKPRPELPVISVAWLVNEGSVETAEDGVLTIAELADGVEAATR